MNEISTSDDPQPTRYLLYFADPMCSWCYGFAPAIDQITEEFADTLPLRLVMGGLRPHGDEPLDDRAKREKRGHWEQVQAASGQPFNFDFFERDGFVDNTEPACRAVVAARRLAPENALPMMKTLQRAYYLENSDVTDPGELRDRAVAIGVDGEAFRAAFDDTDTMDETRNDFWIAHKAGIGGFPTLIAFNGGNAQAVSIGYSPWRDVAPALRNWIIQTDAAAATAAD